MTTNDIIRELQFIQVYELEQIKAAIEAEIVWRKVSATMTPDDERIEREAWIANQD